MLVVSFQRVEFGFGGEVGEGSDSEIWWKKILRDIVGERFVTNAL